MVRVQVSIDDRVGQYEPSSYRNNIVRMIGDALPLAAAGDWWYFLATPTQAFVFVHDVSQPKMLSISNAEAYVRVADGPTTVEAEWALTPGHGFERTREQEDELTWFHGETGITLTVLLSQRPHPVAAYDLHLRQTRIVQQLKQFKFRAVGTLAHPGEPNLRSRAFRRLFHYRPDDAKPFKEYAEPLGATFHKEDGSRHC